MEIGVQFELELRFEFGQQQSPTHSLRSMLTTRSSVYTHTPYPRDLHVASEQKGGTCDQAIVGYVVPVRPDCYGVHWSGFFPLWSRVDYFHTAPPVLPPVLGFH